MPKPPDTTRLLELLSQESFPLEYLHKFIGKNSPEFKEAVAQLAARFPAVHTQHVRESGKSHAYLAYSFSLTALQPKDVTDLVEATSQLPGLALLL